MMVIASERATPSFARATSDTPGGPRGNAHEHQTDRDRLRGRPPVERALLPHRGHQQELASLGALPDVGRGGHAHVDGGSVLPRPGDGYVGLLAGIQDQGGRLDLPPSAGLERELGLNGGAPPRVTGSASDEPASYGRSVTLPQASVMTDKEPCHSQIGYRL